MDHPARDLRDLRVDPSAPVRVVAVDDDQGFLPLLERILRDAGHSVRTFRSPAEALAGMLADPPDVLLADWFMPGMEGPDLVRSVRDAPALRGTYCILLTAHDAGGRKVQGLRGGADDYLTKPADEGEILARVAVGARVRRLEREATMLAVAATLGHEINNPLTGVLGYLELVRAHLAAGDRDRVLQDLGRIEKAAERIRAVVARLMDLPAGPLKEYLPGTFMIDVDGPGGEGGAGGKP